MYVAKDYSAFLQHYNWNYFITCRTPYKIHTMTVRNWIRRLFNRSHKVDNIFFVSERDKGDFYNLHVHMLLDTNTNMTYKEVRYGLGNISVGDYQPVYSNKEVCKYVTKHMGKDMDYDIVFKS